jgi:hypothetical protein
MPHEEKNRRLIDSILCLIQITKKLNFTPAGWKGASRHCPRFITIRRFTSATSPPPSRCFGATSRPSPIRNGGEPRRCLVSDLMREETRWIGCWPAKAAEGRRTPRRYRAFRQSNAQVEGWQSVVDLGS